MRRGLATGLALASGISLLVGIMIGVRLAPRIEAAPGQVAALASQDLRQKDHRGTELTSPLLECAELPEGLKDISLREVKRATQALIDAAKEKGDVSYASVYFRDLNNGPWFGINESEKFSPASLLKVPLAMSFYWNADPDLHLLEKADAEGRRVAA